MSEGRDYVARRVEVESAGAGGGSNYFLGLPRTQIFGMDTCLVRARPAAAFRPTYIVVPAAIALDFMILGVRVGKNEQLIRDHPISAAVFGGDVVVLRDQVVGAAADLPLAMKMDDCLLGEEVCLVVQNCNPQARWFFGAVAGPPL